MASCRVIVESVADDEFAVLVAADDGVAHSAVGAAVVVRRRRRRDADVEPTSPATRWLSDGR